MKIQEIKQSHFLFSNISNLVRETRPIQQVNNTTWYSLIDTGHLQINGSNQMSTRGIQDNITASIFQFFFIF